MAIGAPAPVAISILVPELTNGGTITWTKVASSDGQGSSYTMYGESTIDDGHVYRLPQSQWPAGKHTLFYASSTNWKRAECDTELRAMQVGTTYSCSITRSDGSSYTIMASFRQRWGRYFPVSQSQGRNCDLSNDAASALFETSSADCGSLVNLPGIMAIGAPAPVAISILVPELTNGGTITWTKVASSDGQGSSYTMYGESTIDDGHVYRLPQSQWPAGKHTLFYASSTNWKRAECDTELRAMQVGTTYSCSITRSDGSSYTIMASFRQRWGRYFPVSQSQGRNCDLSNDAASALFETSSADCGSLVNLPGIMAIGR
eukprot:CAMPEP_0181202292 /NCGR_PEP_ID=MMETSP1096-20121128/18762_1 /TAXON_ID=156174 ORGANISM="Chrysochromulina ericina, Strain CCMP281" /NCGR_SAMPLE_ID=MMETSP1096 /ASSEMBLY_ACC=CAM_ASM_000453 /LENGTH=317 /DNA_ID=CAMNT_0023292791 /DNA_START=22 /DNA_END=975 /DNA_ORIENTATION=+